MFEHVSMDVGDTGVQAARAGNHIGGRNDNAVITRAGIICELYRIPSSQRCIIILHQFEINGVKGLFGSESAVTSWVQLALVLTGLENCTELRTQYQVVIVFV